jgi:hypothetical protein
VDEPARRLSESELHNFFALLRRYVGEELDQWDAWLIATRYDDVFLTVTRKSRRGGQPKCLRRHHEPHSTG